MNYDKNISRREWLKRVGLAGLALSTYGVLGNSVFATADSRPTFSRRSIKQFNARFDAKGLPTTVLGRTGVIIPRMGLGLGSRFSEFALRDRDAAIDMLSYALDNGLYYWDTAPIYSAVDKATGRTLFSEDVTGDVVKYRRKEIFLNSKLCTRNPDEMMASVERTFKLLNTDYLDMMMVHGVESMEDFQRIRDNKIIEKLESLRDQKVFRYFGFSGHGEADALKAMADLGRFDVMLMAADPYRVSKSGAREKIAIDAAVAQNMGIMIMKTVRPHEKIPNINIDQMIRMALNIPGATGVMVGMDSKEIVDKNLAILRSL